jgi:small-conductance mechanosensitive channel
MFKKAAFSWLQIMSKKTSTELDDVLIDALDWPLTILIFVSGILVVPKIVAGSALPDNISIYMSHGLKAAIIVAGIFFVNTFLLGLVKIYSVRVEIFRIASGFTQVLVRSLVFSFGALILLDSFGVSITPILASLGVGSLAVALALQPTLENVISGLQILGDRPILPGQFVKLETGEEGYVEKIGWRSTWIRQLANNMVIVPNKQIVNSRVLNYYYPDKELAVLVEVGVHYSSDLKKVEQITCDVGKDVLGRVTGGVPSFSPFIRFHTFSDSSINFTVILRGKEFVDNYLIKHEFIKALQERYMKEGIVIPYPIRAINTEQEKAVFAGVTRNGELQSGKEARLS